MPAKTTKKRPAIKARPTLYRGIQMRSRLEADYAAYLDRDGVTWEYEPECFAGPNAQWLPDFRAALGGEPAYVEVKPAGMFLGEDVDYIDRVDEILARMSVAWLSEPDAPLMLALWTYGASDPDLSVYGMRGVPWQAWSAGSDVTLLWPGMGQMEVLGFALQERAAQQAAGSLTEREGPS